MSPKSTPSAVEAATRLVHPAVLLARLALAATLTATAAILAPPASAAPSAQPAVQRTAPPPLARDGMTLLHVPAGPFIRGADADPAAGPDEKPERQVRLDGFWIDRTEVTNAQFGRFIDATGYETVADQAGYSYGYDGGGNWVAIYGANWRHPFGPGSTVDALGDHPVVGVGWRDARAYCEWVGRRLPSEAEWEKAARGVDGRRYPWGDAPVSAERVNLADSSTVLPWRETGLNDGYRNTAPVDAFPAGASPYGALQMAGNVDEWVEDSYDAGFYADPKSGERPVNRVRGDLKGLRGGNYNDDGAHVRAARRIADDTRHSAIDIGFRCAANEQVAVTWLPLVLLRVVHRLAPTPTATPRPTASPRPRPSDTPPPGNPCDAIPGAAYGQLPMDRPKTNRPAERHADLNIGLRGFTPADEPLVFWDYQGPIDAKAPQLVDLLKRVPAFGSAWRVRQWVWEPEPGHAGPPEQQYPVSLLGLRSRRMEHVHVPDSGYGFEQGFMVMVLYASEERITLKYTKDDSMVRGYGLQLEDVCVEPGLLALYRRLDAEGRDQLPAVAAHMPIGRARGEELRVTIRDTGTFMDPRSEPDWWQRKQAP
jgi:formylglycine-generating enzyme required for sulfatase activity